MSHKAVSHSRLALSIFALFAVTLVWAATGMEDLAGPLRTLAAQASQGGVGTASAQRLGVTTRGNQVAVTILYRSEAGAAATSLTRFGGRAASRIDRRVEAFLPADALLQVASLPQVALITPTPMMVPLQGFGATTSEGVQLTNATAFHLAGINGSGVKVAVIDTGFVGLPAEVPVLPTDVVDLRLAGGVMSAHGTAVAEIVADMAPQADMTLIIVDTPQSVERAITYVTDQRFQVVNMSLGLPDGPFNGTHPLSMAVNRARDAGIFWVNSAGNWAQQHWQGSWVDDNSDGFLEFEGSKDTMNLDLQPGVFDAYLSWFEGTTGVTAIDYDLVLTDSSGALVARSAVTQDGDDPPKEQLEAFIGVAGQYRLKVQRLTLPVAGETPSVFQLFTPNVDIETTLQHPEDSLAIPAEATGAYTVGATRGVSLPIPNQPTVPFDRIEPFSSRGDIGSTAKPNIVAPDGVKTSIAAFNPFMGTSAAAPHVTGAVALLLSEDSSRSLSAVRTLLAQMARKYVVPTDIPDTDINAYGVGRLDLRVGSSIDGDAPGVRIEFPLNNTTITVASPHCTITTTDQGGVDPNSIQVWLDSTQLVTDGVVQDPVLLTDYLFDPATGSLTFVLNNLTRTLHALKVQVADNSGNTTPVVVSNFRIATPTISAGLHIISLPYPDMVNDDPSVVFGVPADQMALLRWVPTDSRFSKYHIYPDEFASFNPPDQLVPQPPAGLGYFLSLPSAGTLNISAGGVTADSYNISLIYGSDAPRGWNLIGNPYESFVDWGSAEFISANGRQDLREAMDPDNSPVTEGVLFEFVTSAGGGYYSFAADPTQATLEPLKGYWLHVLKDATLVVHNTGNTAVAAAPRPKPKAVAPSDSNWLLQLQARAGQYEDPINYIGVSSAASDGYDIGLDVSEPPPLTDSLQMYMPSGVGHFAKDMRSASQGRQEWDVEVACRLTNTPINITWPTLNATVPRGLTLRLEDSVTGASVYMRTASGYSFQMPEPGVRRLHVVATTEAGGALAVTGVSTASARTGQVSFTYSVSRQADVSIEIRNISGALIRDLGAQPAAPGTAQTAVWSGQNQAGLRVPAGRYLARITARATDGQSAQSIHPFNVNR